MRWFRPSPHKVFARALGDIERDIFFRHLDEHTAMVAGAAVFGAATVGEGAVTSLPSLKHLWGRGDRTKASALLEVFSWPMLLRWLASVDEQQDRPKKIRLAARPNWGKMLLEMFDDFSEERLKRLLDLDTQYQYERAQQDKLLRGEETTPHFEEAHLLWAEAVAALGGTFPLTGWPAKGFPFADLFALWDAGVGEVEDRGLPRDEMASMTLRFHLVAGWQATAGYYDARLKAMR